MHIATSDGVVLRVSYVVSMQQHHRRQRQFALAVAVEVVACTNAEMFCGLWMNVHVFIAACVRMAGGKRVEWSLSQGAGSPSCTVAPIFAHPDLAGWYSGNVRGRSLNAAAVGRLQTPWAAGGHGTHVHGQGPRQESGLRQPGPRGAGW